MSKNLTQFAILGLGRFGEALAIRLFELGKDVLVVDTNEERVHAVADLVTHAIVADASDEEVLTSIGIKNFDVVVVCMGSNFEASAMTTLVCKSMGVPYIVAKANSQKHKTILEKIGVDFVIFPEYDMGRKVASLLINPNLRETIDLSSKVRLIELKTPTEWVGITLQRLDIRRLYGLTVILIKRENGDMVMSPSGDDIPLLGDNLILCGETQNVEKVVKKFIKVAD